MKYNFIIIIIFKFLLNIIIRTCGIYEFNHFSRTKLHHLYYNFQFVKMLKPFYHPYRESDPKFVLQIKIYSKAVSMTVSQNGIIFIIQKCKLTIFYI